MFTNVRFSMAGMCCKGIRLNLLFRSIRKGAYTEKGINGKKHKERGIKERGIKEKGIIKYLPNRKGA
jgi:hypothetical protein